MASPSAGKAAPGRGPFHLLDPRVVSQLKTFDVRARLVVEGFMSGMHPSPAHGYSVEFAEHRPYTPGEPLRNLDWKVYGKRDRLYVRRYEEETNLRCTILMDVSDSMRYPGGGWTKLQYGAHLAAALAYLMTRQRDAVGLLLFDDAIRLQHPPRTQLSRLAPIFTALEQEAAQAASYTRRTATASVIHQAAPKLGRRGLLVLISDLLFGDEPLREVLGALQHLRHQKHEVLLLQPLDPATELNLHFPTNGPVVLKDLETGRTLPIFPADLRAAYQARMAERQEQLRRRCRERNIELHTLPIDQPYGKALRDYLVHRQRLVRG